MSFYCGISCLFLKGFLGYIPYDFPLQEQFKGKIEIDSLGDLRLKRLI